MHAGCPQEEDIPWVNGAGEEVLVSRSFYRAQVVAYSDKACWCKEKKQRVTEYDAVYWYLHQYAINVAKTENTLFDVHDAAKRVQVEKKNQGWDDEGGQNDHPAVHVVLRSGAQGSSGCSQGRGSSKGSSSSRSTGGGG
jgi:uncharacterized membrane protein YgcG